MGTTTIRSGRASIKQPMIRKMILINRSTSTGFFAMGPNSAVSAWGSFSKATIHPPTAKTAVMKRTTEELTITFAKTWGTSFRRSSW